MTSTCEELRMRPPNRYEVFFYGGELQSFSMQPQFKLCGEDNFCFSCVGHHPHPGVPREYMEGGRVERAEREMSLS